VVRRRVLVDASGEGMPAHLTRWEDFADPDWVVPASFSGSNASWERYRRRREATRQLMAARAEYLRGCAAKPSGVYWGEWLKAHGLAHSERYTARARALGYREPRPPGCTWPS